MTAYAVGNLPNLRIGPAIIAYLQAIDATLAPVHGRFLIHSGDKTVQRQCLKAWRSGSTRASWALPPECRC